MIVYEIETKVRIDLIGEFEEFMLNTHIPDLLETGYFDSAEFARVTDGIYRARYLVEDRQTLEKYFETDVERLRKDFGENFPEGVDTARRILGVIKTWKSG